MAPRPPALRPPALRPECSLRLIARVSAVDSPERASRTGGLNPTHLANGRDYVLCSVH